MTRRQRVKGGAVLGAVVAATYFVADTAGAALAIRTLIDPTLEQFVLVTIAGVNALLVGVIGGAVIGALWPARYTRRLSKRSGVIFIALFGLVVASAGYGTRVGRRAVAMPAPPSVSAQRPYDVLWINIDTLRADTLYGPELDFPLTPKLRAFADGALVFTDAEAAAGWTIPSVATLMTGIHPVTLYSARHFVPAWAPTVAERMHAAGYRTVALMDNALLESRNGFADGFEDFFQKSALRFAFSLPSFRLLPTRLRESLRESLYVFYYGAEKLTDVALQRMTAESSAPLFMYVHYMDVHYPYYPHDELGPDPEGSEPIALHYAMKAVREDPAARPSDAQMKFLWHRYENEIRYLDGHLGRLLSGWRNARGRDTVIMITADHGEEFLDHGELGHGHNLHRELVWVPLILQVPDAEAVESRRTGRISHVIGQVDMVPTLLGLTGVDPEQAADGVPLQGVSWTDWLRGAEAPEQPVFATQHRHGRRIYRWRMDRWAQIETFYRDGTGQAALYDLQRDPTEQRNVHTTEGDADRALSASFQPFMRAQEAARDPKPVVRGSDEESLRALGYIQ